MKLVLYQSWDKAPRLISKTPNTEEAKPLIEKLTRLRKGYEIAGAFSQRIKAEMIRKMMTSSS
jgi:hypothetical protein